MVSTVFLWGLAVGALHIVVTGAFYGNPIVDRIYAQAMKDEPGVRSWGSKPRYLVTQIAGTQVEIWILTAGYVWLRPLVPIDGLCGSLALGLLFSGIRVYPRFWNMWIQSTYPNRLLAIEALGGTLSTFLVTTLLYYWLS